MQSSENMVNETILKKFFPTIGLTLLAFAFISFPAEAHHPWESQMGNFNFLQGFASGLAHPILGFDHLLFLISVGLIGGVSLFTRVPLLLFVGLLGTTFSQFIPIFSGAETVMGVSVVCASLVAFGRLPLVLIPIFVFSHGFVLGNSMIGAEPTPLIAYSLGLLVIQTLIVYLGRFALKRFWENKNVILWSLFGAGMTITISSIL